MGQASMLTERPVLASQLKTLCGSQTLLCIGTPRGLLKVLVAGSSPDTLI